MFSDIYPMIAFLGGNAVATAHDGNKIIVYHSELSRKVGYSGAMMVLGHELGNHFCRHLDMSADCARSLPPIGP